MKKKKIAYEESGNRLILLFNFLNFGRPSSRYKVCVEGRFVEFHFSFEISLNLFNF